MERLTDNNPCNTCKVDRQIGNPYSWQCECDRCLKPSRRKDECVKKLEEYEDLGEQWKLLKLFCKAGDTVYRINKGAKEPIIPMKVCEVGAISLKVVGFAIQIMCRDELDNGETHYLSTDFGKAVFLTKSEAEQELRQLENKGSD